MTDSSSRSSAWKRPPAQYDDPPRWSTQATRRSVYVSTRDNTRLAVDVYLPAELPEGTQLPAIVCFTPYYRRLRVRDGYQEDGIGPSIAYARDAFVPYGYAVVTVDVRGTGASFGSRRGFRSPSERSDYHDVADWIVTQAWCNGRIGSTGISYAGAAADFLASSGHPAVKAIIPSFSVWDTYKNMFYPGGLLCTTVRDSYGAITRALDRNDMAIVSDHPYFSNPAYDGPAPVDGDDGSLLQVALKEHAANFEMTNFIQALECRDSSPLGDPDLTSLQISPSTYASGFSTDVAVYSISGWRDGYGYAEAAVRRHRSLGTPHKHLILGPWDHGAVVNASPLKSEVSPQFELFNEYRRFFDHYLRADSTGLADEAPVHYFTMIEEKWKSTETWPPENGLARSFYLHARGAALEQPAGEQQGTSSFLVDFDVSSGLDSRYERIGLKHVETYYDGWPSVAAGRLSFTTKAMEQSVEITGHPKATIFLSSTSRDGALFVYIEDIDEAGKPAYVTEGVLRLLHLKTIEADPHAEALGPDRAYLKENAFLLTPGETIEVEIPLIPVSWLVRRGHRIRFSIAGADAAHFARVPVGETPVLTVLHDRHHPSRFLLPTMPVRATI